jgi:hypothetical protein
MLPLTNSSKLLVGSSGPGSSSSSAFREGAVLVAVLAVTCVVFVGILRTRDEGIFSANAAAREEAKIEVEKIEKQIQKRLRAMSEAMAKQTSSNKQQSSSAGVKGKRGKKGGPPPFAFKHFDPDARHPLTPEELAELKADLHDILESPSAKEQDADNKEVKDDASSSSSDKIDVVETKPEDSVVPT